MPPHNPVIVLDHPQLARNIGMVARAMLNFELTTLRLVNPPSGWCNENTLALSAGADEVLLAAQTFSSLTEATADLHYLYATTARNRDMVKRIFSPSEVALEITKQIKQSMKVGVIFGAEKSGLTNESIALTNALIRIPTNPKFSSLNLAQSVLTIAYELLVSQNKGEQGIKDIKAEELASREELDGFLTQLLESLTTAGYFRTDHKRKVMSQNLINIFTRTPMTSQEVRTLRGVVSTLTNPNGVFSRKTKKSK